MPRPAPRTLWRRTAAGGVLVLALTGLAACGGGDSGDSDDSDSHGSAAAAGLDAGDPVSKSEMAAILTKAATSFKTAHMAMDTTTSVLGQQMNVTADGDVQVSPPATQMEMSLSGQKVSVLYVDKVMYLQVPGMTSGDMWGKLDPADFGQVAGLGGMSDAMTNPLAVVSKLGDAVDKATYEGSESIDGADADHYKVTVDGKSLMSAMGVDSSSAGAKVPATLDEELWVDDEGRIVQSKVDMGDLGDTELHLSDFDEKVDLKAPPSGKVTDLSGLMKGVS